MAEDISIQSMALQKRNAETALMPPPPPPKRLKRPAKILSEDDYTSALTAIVERDFFPNLAEMRKHSRYLDALEEGNPVRIATAARRLVERTPVVGPNQASDQQDDEETEEEKKERILNEDVKGMRLDMFQAKYTSEDNESFNDLLDEQNRRQQEKFAWKYQGNKKLTKQQMLIEQKKVLLLENGGGTVPGERPEGDEETWSKEVQTWDWTPNNVLMNPHPGLEDQEDLSQGQKVIRHDNTRVPESKASTGKTPAPSPSFSTVQDAISGRRMDTPKVAGYSFVSTPRSEETPQMTWDSVPSSSLPAQPDTPSPFRIPEPSERKKLARKLAEKAEKDILARQRAYTPRLRQTTGTISRSTVHTPLKDIPKFASSPDVRKTMLTPAAQRLLVHSVQGRHSNLSGQDDQQGKERETAAQVSGIGRTPLVRTPMLKDAATPLIRK
jgi:protein DGCR14